jgi:hypothetical protein
MAATLVAETALVRNGALRDLAAAAVAKHKAFVQFQDACAAHPPGSTSSESERAAMRALLAAAGESAVVLEAVQAAIGRFLDGVRVAAGTLADAGTYALSGRAARHVLAVHLDASI